MLPLKALACDWVKSILSNFFGLIDGSVTYRKSWLYRLSVQAEIEKGCNRILLFFYILIRRGSHRDTERERERERERESMVQFVGR